MSAMVTIHWFRQDLRLSDNPALFDAATKGLVLPVYILDDVNSDIYKMGAASRCWLHQSLIALNSSLNGQLLVFSGDPKIILSELIDKYNVTTVNWNRCYEPWRIVRDTQIKQDLLGKGIAVNTFNGSLLWEPWEVLKSDKTPYRVFTPFYHNGCLKAIAPRLPLDKPNQKQFFFNDQQTNQSAIDKLELLPDKSWSSEIISNWSIGELAVQQQLVDFMAEGISDYKEGRDFPAKNAVSRLSTYLHFGELSPNQVWYASYAQFAENNFEAFRRQMAWREFSYSLLYYNPSIPQVNLQRKFDNFPWVSDSKLLIQWQKGQTGIPIVDAGMRELWQTGYMHNRVRMIVASFLVKNLLIDWRDGERWFWDCLIDADLANNSASWQWVAGTGADAAPYYRIFNPVTQGQKFDPDGHYTRRYVPELALLANKYLFNPWEAPEEILTAANVCLGIDYPHPLVDLKSSRARALELFKLLTTSQNITAPN
jgi:deoxyribodipyrimidine photo-lyase